MGSTVASASSSSKLSTSRCCRWFERTRGSAQFSPQFLACGCRAGYRSAHAVSSCLCCAAGGWNSWWKCRRLSTSSSRTSTVQFRVVAVDAIFKVFSLARVHLRRASRPLSFLVFSLANALTTSRSVHSNAVITKARSTPQWSNPSFAWMCRSSYNSVGVPMCTGGGDSPPMPLHSVSRVPNEVRLNLKLNTPREHDVEHIISIRKNNTTARFTGEVDCYCLLCGVPTNDVFPQ